MTQADFMILAVSLLSMIAIGFVFAKENRNVGEMFAAGGRSPWWVAGLSSYMTFWSAGAFVVWGGMTFRLGLVAILINLCHGVAALLVGYFVAGKWKALGVRTPAEFMELRFGTAVLSFYTWSTLLIRIASSAVALYALAVMLTTLLPMPEGHWLRDEATGNVSLAIAIALFGAVVIAYTMVGGLWAVLMTDVLQFVIIVITVLYTLVLIVGHAGGVDAALAGLPGAHLNPTAAGFTWLFFAGWTVLHFFQFGAEWAYAQRYISVPTAHDARRGMYLFGALYLVSPIVFFSPALIYRSLNPAANPEQAYMLAAALVLPTGMLGMFVAAMFSATASTVSAQLNLYAGVLTSNTYAKALKRPATESELLWAGRAFTVLLGVFVVAGAIAVPHLGGAEAVVFLLISFIGPLFAPAVWGLLNPRIGPNALWVSLSVSWAVVVICKVGLSGPTLLGGIDALDPVIAWLTAHPYSAEIYFAVVAPLVVLTIADLLLRGRRAESAGWRRVEARIAAVAAQRESVATPSTLPAKFMAIALYFTGLMTLALVPVNREEPAGLLTATALLMAAGTAMAVLGWRTPRNRGSVTPSDLSLSAPRPCPEPLTPTGGR